MSELPEASDKLALELELRMLLIPALQIIHGYASSAVEQAYVQALHLCHEHPSSPPRFMVMAGLSSFYILRGNSVLALEHGEALLALAEARGSDAVAAQTEAHFVVGVALHHLGYHVGATKHLHSVVAFYRQSDMVARCGAEMRHHGVAAQCFLGCSVFMSGRLDRGLQHVEEALRWARDLRDPFALAYALNFTSHLYLLRREPHLALERARALATLCEEKRFGFFAASAILLKAGVQLERGDLQAGLACLHRGWAALQATGAQVYGKHWLGLLARGHALLGQYEQALHFIAVGRSQPAGGETLWDPELLTILGEVLASAEKAGATLPVFCAYDSPRSCFSDALDLARRQGAKLFELRAATQLSRYLRSIGKANEARALLRDIVAGFTEGARTADLEDARMLMTAASGTRAPAGKARARRGRALGSRRH